jgi:hypothetical protein
MNRLPVVGLLAVLALPPSPGPSGDDLARALERLHRWDERPYSCLAEEHGFPGSWSAVEAARRYQARRHLDSLESARALLAGLVEYALQPSAQKVDVWRQAHVRAGSPPAAAEDFCWCVYFSGADDRAALLETVRPTSIGEFWLGRLLHEGDRTAEALSHYRRSLQADPADPRSRLFAAIALVNEESPQEALELLAPIPVTWAPKAVAYWRARALLDAGKPAEARALLAVLPTPWVAETTVPDASTDAAPVQPPMGPECLTMLALASEGDLAGARAYAPKADCEAARGTIELKGGDPFEALMRFEGARDAPGVVRSLARLRACDWARRDLEDLAEWCRKLPRSECVQMVPARKEVEEVCPIDAGGPAPVDPGLSTRLDQPRSMPFEERVVPPEWRSAGDRSQSRGSPPAQSALAQYAVVALSPVAPRMFAVSVSQDVDPRGEVSRGGYWLHLSPDRGHTWTGPFYLGLAEQFPYVVRGRSRVPAFTDERLNLEVERREVDASTITFPPVGLRAKTVAKDLYLSIDIAAVQRDRDGDGLTDLLEEKLALDPAAADTDGDGVVDGLDPTPLQAPAADADDRTAILEVLLPALFLGPSPIQQSAAAGGEASVMAAQPRPFTSLKTLFVRGDVALSAIGGLRVIALPTAAFDVYVKKFGPTYPLALPDIAFDPSHGRAFVRYDMGWRGGTFVVVQRNGKWILTDNRSWVS